MKSYTKLCPTPDLGDDQFLRAVCGLRPCRHGGIRLETEEYESKSIIHNYGHGGSGVTISFGTAEVAADLVDRVASPKEHIAVLGGGIVGLTTARELLSRGYRVTIYADLISYETTSSVAGALWLPVGIEFGDTAIEQRRMCEILKRSRDAFAHLDCDRYGIEELPIYEPRISETPPHLFTNGTIAEPVKIDSFPFESAAEPGRMFRTRFIHNNMFLGAVHEDVINLGGEARRVNFASKDELDRLDERVLVNCMALGSRALFCDKQVYAARGVLVHMKPQDLGYGTHDGFKYMFPRSDALILGGCFHEYDWDDTPDQAMIDEILNHHRRFFGQA